jgi:hypothetical protein
MSFFIVTYLGIYEIGLRINHELLFDFDHAVNTDFLFVWINASFFCTNEFAIGNNAVSPLLNTGT